MYHGSETQKANEYKYLLPTLPSGDGLGCEGRRLMIKPSRGEQCGHTSERIGDEKAKNKGNRVFVIKSRMENGAVGSLSLRFVVFQQMKIQ